MGNKRLFSLFIKVLCCLGFVFVTSACNKIDLLKMKGEDGVHGSGGAEGPKGQDGTSGDNGKDGRDGISLPDDLTLQITSAKIGDTTATIKFTATDTNGNGYNLFKQADVTNGYLVFFLAQLIPPASSGDSASWKNYSNTAVTAPGVSKPTVDKTGTLTLVDSSVGEYSYTFSFNPKTVTSPITVSYNADYLHRVGLQSAYPGREITTGTPNIISKSSTFDFVPSGRTVDGVTTVSKEMSSTNSCNECHDKMNGHDGKYKELKLCVMCHNPSVNLGDSVNYDMPYMVHAIHSYKTKRTTPWRGPLNTGYTGTATEEIALPQSSGNCRKCHHGDTLTNGEAPTGADGNNWKTNPTMKACTSCHNNVDFATASTHVAPGGTINGGIQTSNRNCTVCHYPEMVEAYHTSTAYATAHKPGSGVGTWEKGIVNYPRVSYEISSATIDGGGNLLIDFAIKADGQVIDLLDSSGTGNNVRFATTYSVPSVKKSAATADAPYTKWSLPSVPAFYLAFATDQGSITAANAADWNNYGNGGNGAGIPLQVSLLRLGMRYWAQAYDGAATPVVSALGLVPCLGDVRQTSTTLADCAAEGASGAPGTITAENINLGSLTPRYSGGTLIGFTATITNQTVAALNGSWKSSGVGSTLPKILNQVYPFPAGAKLRSVALGGSMRWDAKTIAYSTPSGTTYSSNLITINAESVVKEVTGDTVRRDIVDANKCANCHERLSMHGGSRVYEPKICAMCHNSNFASSGKTLDSDNPADGLQLKHMIHSIHGAEKRSTPYYLAAGTSLYSWPSNKLGATGLTLFDNFLNTYNGVTWSKDSTAAPVALTKNTTVMTFPGKPNNCLTCHIDATSTTDGTWGVGSVPEYALEMTKEIAPDTTGGAAAGSRDAYTYGRYTGVHDADVTTKPIAASCMGCHDSRMARIHMEQNGGKVSTARNATQVGEAESCVICHGYGRTADADVKHGVKSAKSTGN